MDVQRANFSLCWVQAAAETTTLRLIAGFEQPTSGNVYIGNKMVNDVPIAAMSTQSCRIMPYSHHCL